MPTTVTITLSADLLLSDDGGNFANEQGSDLATMQTKLQERKRHYKQSLTTIAKDYKTFEKTQSDNLVNVINNAEGGTLSISPLRKENA